jgi:hypothetical protein
MTTTQLDLRGSSPVRQWSTVILAALVAACLASSPGGCGRLESSGGNDGADGGSDAPLDSGPPELPDDAGTDSAADEAGECGECCTDEDCDDEEPCNGVERCQPEHLMCYAGAAMADGMRCLIDGEEGVCVAQVCEAHGCLDADHDGGHNGAGGLEGVAEFLPGLPGEHPPLRVARRRQAAGSQGEAGRPPIEVESPEHGSSHGHLLPASPPVRAGLGAVLLATRRIERRVGAVDGPRRAAGRQAGARPPRTRSAVVRAERHRPTVEGGLAVLAGGDGHRRRSGLHPMASRSVAAGGVCLGRAGCGVGVSPSLPDVLERPRC